MTAKENAKSLWLFTKLYWKAVLSILIPLLLMPIFILHNRPAMRCLYVVCIMGAYWVLEILPMGITALLPVVMFPLMSILDSKKIAPCYMSDTNMLFLGGLMVAVSLEHSNLHTRISLLVIKLVGCSPRNLLLGLTSVTMFVSMWISNSAATACMVPVVRATLKELEKMGIATMWLKDDVEGAPAPPPPRTPGNKKEDDYVDEDEGKRPTHLTICYFMSIAFGSSIGGLGTLVGTGTNMVLKGIYEERFVEMKDISFIEWMFIACPIMLGCAIPTVIWLQFLYMGLFRPKCKDALAIKVGKEGEEAAKLVIKNKIAELGPWTFQQIMIGTLFIILVLMWFFRAPQFIPGWASLFTKLKVTDALPAIFIIILMFLIPSKPHCFRAFSKEEELKPTKKSAALLDWKVLQNKIPWGMILLIGSGFAIAEGSKHSGMASEVAAKLEILSALPHVVVMMLSCAIATILTQFTSNVAVGTVLLPVLAQMAVDQGVHPLYYMIPATLGCSFAFMLPVSTPPNAIIVDPSHISSMEMIKVGLGVALICMLITFAIFPFLGPAVLGI